MTKNEKQKRYDQLITLRRELMEQMGFLGGRCLENNKQPGEELADVGSDNSSREVSLNLINGEEEELDLIDDALASLEKGTYGLCEDCKKPIEPGRLNAKPFAKYCIKHKELRELREQGFDVEDID